MQSDVTTCDLCGLQWRGSDAPGGWLALEVTRGDGASDIDWVDADFCSQSHAAEWLARPLPPPQPVQVLPRTWRDRLTEGLLLALLLWVVVLMLLGAYAFARLLLGALD